jgi:galactokinase
MKSFDDIFGGTPTVVATAPGRVNLLGEHTDYNDGYVLPIAIAQRTRVALRASARRINTLYAAALSRCVQFNLDAPPAEHFATYVYGCLRETKAQGIEVPPLDIHVGSEVPIGVGLSSSAALEVATLRALRNLLHAPFDDVLIAQMAQRAEIEHAGVRCGIMDQMAASLADKTHALFLDTRTLDRALVSLPPNTAVLVVDSGIPRSLAASGYNERRAQCEEAARHLEVPALRDVLDESALESLPQPLRRRALHVYTENRRVLRALDGVSAESFGQLMNESHMSLRDDYEVSIAPLDVLVALLAAHPSVYGARLTGAGFGGACVALCDAQALPEVGASVLLEYKRQGFAGGRVLVPTNP